MWKVRGDSVEKELTVVYRTPLSKKDKSILREMV